MCGGIIEYVPCSHVGHVFRTERPYGFPGKSAFSTITYNTVRMAKVWIDEYQSFYFGMNPGTYNCDFFLEYYFKILELQKLKK